MSKFAIRQTASGFKFDLLAANGQIILSSEVYTSRAAARKSIASICQFVSKTPVENQTEDAWNKLPHPKFQLYRDKAGQYRFRLKARNGKIIGISESYSTKAGALNGIDSVKKNAPEAEIEA